jgi:hypothetical protein
MLTPTFVGVNLFNTILFPSSFTYAPYRTLTRNIIIDSLVITIKSNIKLFELKVNFEEAFKCRLSGYMKEATKNQRIKISSSSHYFMDIPTKLLGFGKGFKPSPQDKIIYILLSYIFQPSLE